MHYEIAWAAGLFDGEGYVYINSARVGSYSLCAGLQMVDEACVRTFSRVVGVPYRKRGTTTSTGKPIYACKASAQKAANMLVLLQPFIVNVRQRERIAVVLEFQRAKIVGPHYALSETQFLEYKSVQCAYKERLRLL